MNIAVDAVLVYLERYFRAGVNIEHTSTLITAHSFHRDVLKLIACVAHLQNHFVYCVCRAELGALFRRGLPPIIRCSAVRG